MKHKVPQDVLVYPDNGRQAIYDPVTETISTLAGDMPIHVSLITGRRQLERFREWAATLSKGQ